MAVTFWIWISAAVILVVAAGLLGEFTIKRGLLGILIDNRGRYSLTQLQLVLWTIVVLSLIGGVAGGRLLAGAAALGFSIPDALLAVMGISLGSTASAATIKASKDAARARQVAASNPAHPPRLSQIFLVEEGALADQVVDVTKFQNFWLTFLLVGSYVSLAISEIQRHDSIGNMTALPGFPGTLATLLGISHAAYLAGKLPNPTGDPPLSLARMQQGAARAAPAAGKAAPTPPTVESTE